MGKTHLALSLAVRAAEHGRRVYFTTLADLLHALEDAQAAGLLPQRLRTLVFPSLMVIDEIGYLPITRTGAMLFFQLLARRYERASTILTSNKGFEDWGEIFGDEGHGRGAHRPARAPLSHRQHPRKRLSAAATPNSPGGCTSPPPPTPPHPRATRTSPDPWLTCRAGPPPVSHFQSVGVSHFQSALTRNLVATRRVCLAIPDSLSERPTSERIRARGTVRPCRLLRRKPCRRLQRNLRPRTASLQPPAAPRHPAPAAAPRTPQSNPPDDAHPATTQADRATAHGSECGVGDRIHDLRAPPRPMESQFAYLRQDLLRACLAHESAIVMCGENA
ncbi:MAG: ATP-binding protein [Gemmatimonadetes bacterium]|nr:ATP-binding protein [Gemmatimonadota bacterium]